MHYLSRSCARQSLLPKSLLNPSGCSSKAITYKHSGFASVRRGQYDGQEVAVKLLNDLRRSRGVRVAQLVVPFSELIMFHAEVLRVGRGMEHFRPPERAAIVGGDDDQTSVRDRIEVDGEREYQQIFEGVPWCKPTRTCAFTGCPSSPVDMSVEKMFNVAWGCRQGAGLSA